MNTILKSKYTVGDRVLCLSQGETLGQSTYYFGTVTLVEANPDVDGSELATLKEGEAPILYALRDITPKLGDEILLWEHQIICAITEAIAPLSMATA